ncbi:hypothetical protein GCM10018965_066260 [Nonomuraea roseola]
MIRLPPQPSTALAYGAAIIPEPESPHRRHYSLSVKVAVRALNERGDSIDGPTSEDIRKLLNELSAKNRFLILERSDAENSEYYMQAYRQDDGTYRLEHREGGADAHFQTACRDIRVLTQAFTMWMYRISGWRDAFHWEAWRETPTGDVG